MLLGREPERQAIGRLLDEARDGRSAVVALVGEPGIGKTSLLELAAEQAVGMRVLRARGVPSEMQIPFAGLFELLRPTLDSLGAIPAPQAAALESALALRPARAEERFAIGAATLSLLGAYAELQPVAVLVDDVQWLDGSSADALRFAFRRLLAEPIAVVIAARDGEPSLLDGTDISILRVAGLDADAARELVHSRDAQLAERLYRETGGNPLALLELAGEQAPELAPDVPLPVVTTVADAYVQRATGLPDATRTALVLAAATDRGDLGLLTRAAERMGVSVVDLDPAVAAGLVTVDAGRIEFRHPLARSALYAAAEPETRRSVHRALAETLPDADADRRAWHLGLATAGPDERASSALAQAADRARSRSAYDVASQAFERAARLAPEPAEQAPLLYAAADSAWLGGHADRAVALLDEAADGGADGALAVEIEHLRGHVAIWRGPLGEGERVLRAAAERADPATAVVMLAEVVMSGFYSADAASMREAGERAAALATMDSGARTMFFGRIAEGMALVFGAEGDRGAAAIREAVEILESADELRDDPRLLVWAAMGPLWLREAGGARHLVHHALATARRHAAVGALPNLLLHVAIDHAASDRWMEAATGFDEAIVLSRETAQNVVLAGALSRLAWLEARMSHAERCREHAEEALAIAREQGAGLYEIWALAALRDLALAQGDVETALREAERQQRLLDEHSVTDPDLSPAPEFVELLLRAGREEDAEAYAASAEREASAKGQPWALARAARARALVAGDDRVDELFAEALVLHDETPDLFETARTRLAYGARLRRSGERTRAREQLRAAIETFDRLGAAPWADVARNELDATGETARRRDPSSLDELTPQELRVAMLLADGRTTREAAAALFLSPKTIEYHLRNVYRKLATHSRDELREALGDRTRGVRPPA